jgi:rhodanese-related sulfurtransferase
MKKRRLPGGITILPELLIVALATITFSAWADSAPPETTPEVTATAPDIARIDPQAFVEYLADNYDVALIDARSPEEYAEAHLPGAVNIPYDQIDEYMQYLPANPVGDIIVYCRTGRRASLLKKELTDYGYSNVQVLPGTQIINDKAGMGFNCGTSDAPRRCE